MASNRIFSRVHIKQFGRDNAGKADPKAAATVNRTVSLRVSRKVVIDAACQADPITTVARPP
jgi:hypothetical protein